MLARAPARGCLVSHKGAETISPPRTAGVACWVPAGTRRRRRLPTIPPHAGPARVGPLAAPVFKATGVPLVEQLMEMPTVEAAGRHSLALVLAAAAGAALGCLVLHLIDRHLRGRLEQRATFDVLAAAVVATLEPAQALLPFYAASYCAAVAAALAQVAATKMDHVHFAGLCFGIGEQLLQASQWVALFLYDTSRLVLVAFAGWAAIRLKNRLMGWLAWGLAADQDKGTQFAAGLLAPVSVALTVGILLMEGATALAAYGVDMGPFLTSLGGFSVAIGLAVQSLSSNVVASLGLLAGRPFLVGDRVQLLARGSPVVTGVVIMMGPLRVVVRDDDGNPVYLSNTEVGSCNVRNLTQGDQHRAQLPPAAA